MSDTFESWLIRRGYRESTVSYYVQKLKQIQSECPTLSLNSVDALLTSKRQKGGKASSLNKLISTLQLWSEYSGEKWPLKLGWFRQEETYKGIFSDEEIEQIIGLKCPPNLNKRVWERWTMWLQVLAFSGMRASEVSTLTVNQVDWGSNNFILTQTKTVPRRVPIAANLKEPLREYMKSVEWYLFPVPGKRGHVWRNGWQKHMTLRMKMAGIQRAGLSTHSFRHSFITNLLEEDVTLPDIMNIVGHKSAESTLKYSHLGNKSAQKSINKHSIVKKHQSPIEQLESLVEEARKAGLLNSDNFTWKLDRKSLVIEITDKE